VAASRILIVGGGVTGLSTAYHLAQRGQAEIVLLEKGPVGDGSSTRAGGIVTGHLSASVPIQVRKISLRRFKELADELPDYTYHDVGCLNIYGERDRPARDAMRPLLDQHAAPYEYLDAAEMRRRWPALVVDDTAMANFDPLGGYSEPDEYVPALAAGCRRLGVDIREFTPVSGFRLSSGRCAGVETPAGTVEADLTLCASHAWTTQLLAGAGWTVPAKYYVHQRFVTSPMAQLVLLPAVNNHLSDGYYRPADGNRLLVGVSTDDRLEHPAPAAGERLAGLSIDTVALHGRRDAQLDNVDLGEPISWETTKIGLIAFSADSEPIMGGVPGIDSLYVAGCFHSGGFAYNPGVGYVLSELLLDGKASVDMSYYAPDRFAAADVEAYLRQPMSEGQVAAVRNKRH
jgi:glycine/D-amino acid oxidase-like deaminating enzyme